MRKRIFALLCGVLLGAVCTAAAGAATLTTNETFKNPVAEGADPFVLLDDGVYYLYSTNDGANGYIVYTSTDLANWQARGYAMKKNGAAQGSFWAPEVIREGDTYYMVYTSKERIGIATPTARSGPSSTIAVRFFRTVRSLTAISSGMTTARSICTLSLFRAGRTTATPRQAIRMSGSVNLTLQAVSL